MVRVRARVCIDRQRRKLSYGMSGTVHSSPADRLLAPPPTRSIFLAVVRPLPPNLLAMRAWLAPNGTFLCGDQQFASMCGMTEGELVGARGARGPWCRAPAHGTWTGNNLRDGRILARVQVPWRTGVQAAS